ncbi:hypothetical protein ES703_88953 [subsurface metagenome]
MKKFFIILLLSFNVLCGSQNDHLKYGTPSRNGTILEREGYVLLHDSLKKVPLWVSYHLTRQHLQGTQERVDRFKPDPDLPKGERAELSDYKGSGYDRGHMAPAGDMKRSLNVMLESFYLSNMCPQEAGLNRYKWRILEEKVRNFTRKEGDSWIITGPVFMDMDNDGDKDCLEKIGSNKVWVPTHFYKIIIDDDPVVTAYSFLMPNRKPENDIEDYAVTVDSLEALTGFDFLNILPDSEEEAVESRILDVSLFLYAVGITESSSHENKGKNEEYEEEKGGIIYHGNVKSKVFHKPGCRYYNCKDCTATFRSRQNAINAGYRPCKICKP